MFAVVVALLGAMVSVVPARALSDTGTGGQFVSATGRLVNGATVAAGAWTTVQIAGKAGIPTDGSAGSVVLNATVDLAPGVGQLFGRPDSSTTSTLMVTYDGGNLGTTSGSSTIAIGADGTVQLQANTTGKIYLDVEGYYTSTADGVAPGGFVAVPGTRVVDTRSGLGATKATIAPGGSVTLQIGGKGSVPTTASGVVANFLVVNESSNAGYITPYTTGTTKPGTSLNYAPSVPTSDTAQVKLSSAGQVTVFNASGAAGTIDLVVDVQGYFTAAGSNTGAVFTPASGVVYSTRISGNTAVPANSSRSFPVAGIAGIPVMGSGITAVALRVEARHAALTTGDATVWADGTTKPGTTTVNFIGNSIRDNTAIVALGSNGSLDIYNRSSDSSDFLIYLEGWYVDSQSPKVACQAPYAHDSWTTTLPSVPISCSVTAPAVSETGQTLNVTVDGNDDQTATYSLGSSPFTASATVYPTGGSHFIIADIENDEGEQISYGEYDFYLGDWTASTWVGLPGDGTSAPTAPVLAVSPDSDANALPMETSRIYTVSANADLSNPIVISDGLDDSFTVPDGLLESGRTYYWHAVVTGPVDYFGHSASVTTPTWSFGASSSVEQTDPEAGSDQVASIGDGGDGYAQTGSGMPSEESGGEQPQLSGEVKYGPCTLKVPYPHTRKSGNWQVVGVKPITQCNKGTKVVLNYDHTQMYYLLLYTWNLKGGSPWTDSSNGKLINKFVQKNVNQPCNGTHGTWWIGQTTSAITYRGTVYYVSNKSKHSYLACGG